jgi:hypothetical protein
MAQPGYGLRSVDKRSPATDGNKPHRVIFPKKLRLLALAIVIVLVGGGIAFVKLHHTSQDLSDVKIVMSKVSKHYLLPTNETPALATVTDDQKVQNGFKGKVKDGDKILIYENNKIALVYRPSIDRVVDVEPVTVTNPDTSGTGTSIPNINPFGSGQ